MSINIADTSEWESILTTLNTKRVDVGLSPISLTFEGIIKRSYLTTLRDGVGDLFSYFGLSRSEAFTLAGYSYTNWSDLSFYPSDYPTTPKLYLITDKNLEELENLLNLFKTVKIHCHNPEGVEINRILEAFSNDYYSYYPSLPYHYGAFPSAQIKIENDIGGYDFEKYCTTDSDYTTVTALGSRNIQVVFNTYVETITSYSDGDEIYITFNRTGDYDMASYLDSVSNYNGSGSFNETLSQGESITEDIIDASALNSLAHADSEVNARHTGNFPPTDINVEASSNVNASLTSSAFSASVIVDLSSDNNDDIDCDVNAVLNGYSYFSNNNNIALNADRMYYCGYKQRTGYYPGIMINANKPGLGFSEPQWLILPKMSGYPEDPYPRCLRVFNGYFYSSIFIANNYNDSILASKDIEEGVISEDSNNPIASGSLEDFFFTSVPYNTPEVPVG